MMSSDQAAAVHVVDQAVARADESLNRFCAEVVRALDGVSYEMTVAHVQRSLDALVQVQPRAVSLLAAVAVARLIRAKETQP